MQRRYNVLIVDNDAHTLATWQNFLTQHKFLVDTAHNGLDALKKLRQDEFEVAVVELKLPDMSGIEIAQRVQQEGIDTDIIILTDYGDKKDAIAAIKTGVVEDWFEKSTVVLDQVLANRIQEVAQVFTHDEIRRVLSAIPQENWVLAK